MPSKKAESEGPHHVDQDEEHSPSPFSESTGGPEGGLGEGLLAAGGGKGDESCKLLVLDAREIALVLPCGKSLRKFKVRMGKILMSIPTRECPPHPRPQASKHPETLGTTTEGHLTDTADTDPDLLCGSTDPVYGKSLSFSFSPKQRPGQENYMPFSPFPENKVAWFAGKVLQANDAGKTALFGSLNWLALNSGGGGADPAPTLRKNLALV